MAPSLTTYKDMDKIKSYFFRDDNEHSTPPSKRRKRHEPGHGEEDHRHNNYKMSNSAHSTPPGKRRRRQEPGHGDEDHEGTSNIAFAKGGPRFHIVHALCSVPAPPIFFVFG